MAFAADISGRSSALVELPAPRPRETISQRLVAIINDRAVAAHILISDEAPAKEKAAAERTFDALTNRLFKAVESGRIPQAVVATLGDTLLDPTYRLFGHPSKLMQHRRQIIRTTVDAAQAELAGKYTPLPSEFVTFVTLGRTRGASTWLSHWASEAQHHLGRASSAARDALAGGLEYAGDITPQFSVSDEALTSLLTLDGSDWNVAGAELQMRNPAAELAQASTARHTRAMAAANLAAWQGGGPARQLA